MHKTDQFLIYVCFDRSRKRHMRKIILGNQDKKCVVRLVKLSAKSCCWPFQVIGIVLLFSTWSWSHWTLSVCWSSSQLWNCKFSFVRLYPPLILYTRWAAVLFRRSVLCSNCVWLILKIKPEKSLFLSWEDFTWALRYYEVNSQLRRFVRERLQCEALPKSWHCQDWLNPPPPNPGTLVDFATKSA